MIYTIVISSVAPIIRLVIGIGYYWPLFLKDVADTVKHVPIMSFLVIIASLIAFMILTIIDKMLIFIERIRNRR